MVKRNVSYGRQFTKKINGKNRKVMYRYLNKDKKSKVLVYVSNKQPCKVPRRSTSVDYRYSRK